MKVEDCYQLGYVIKTHGLKGEVQFFLDVDAPSEYQDLESVLVKQGNALIPFFLDHIQINSKKSIAKIEDIDSIEEANKLVGCELYLPLSNLPDLPNGQYYYHQLVGLTLVNQGKELGIVDSVYEIAPQNLLSITHQGKEIMIPINDQIIESVDFEKNIILAKLPEGLLEVYLEDNED
ncbi:ribosome maturation factor RimM [Gilvimarinus agarilyticus]|uniref:Ribosome maturation factor RimM n=1 Tax=Reichenbachiella agariperforans TaxID=156994 RepID=A0A1M6RY02_REIAG|nr:MULTISPECIES: ribosome maturation factor RimM [Reichenbachiella]MBU2884877.1 ribosome maturation factor RimM [Gilvimarinus agarilyticus]MBU2914976.1 ribosome maturation factor RimM [Reichenbachiella agariperforans]RJE70407.1 16S rRNA processing protein RimM [Reichenbachiella sp. MSK19-1]SHK37323.1 16S rRNA processing protein RimM [Reichenbachiella agariperforans]